MRIGQDSCRKGYRQPLVLYLPGLAASFLTFEALYRGLISWCRPRGSNEAPRSRCAL